MEKAKAKASALPRKKIGSALTYGDMNCLRAAKNAKDAGMPWRPYRTFAGSVASLLSAGFITKLDTGGFAITEAGLVAHAALPKTKAERIALVRATRAKETAP